MNTLESASTPRTTLGKVRARLSSSVKTFQLLAPKQRNGWRWDSILLTVWFPRSRIRTASRFASSDKERP